MLGTAVQRLALPEIEFILQDSVVEVTADGLYGGWAQSSARHAPDVRNADAILFQMYTSGTTGNPKGALISQRNVLALMANGCRELGPFEETSRAIAALTRDRGCEPRSPPDGGIDRLNSWTRTCA